jgi:hypothetical protein
MSHCGIEANPDKVKAIKEMRPSRNLKEMHRDMGWPDLLSKLAVVMMMMIDNLVSPMISPR